MINFDTNIAKYANKIIYTQENLKDILIEFNNIFEQGLFTQDEKGNTLLHYVISKNAEETFSKIISNLGKRKCISPQTTNNTNCNTTECNCLNRLFNIANHKGMTSLHIACSLNTSQIADILIQEGAGILAQNSERITPLEIAIKVDNKEFIDTLFNSNYENFLTTKFAGKTLLHLAVENISLEVIKSLCEIEKLSLINSIDFQKYTPLMIAAEIGRVDLVELLLSSGAEINLNNGQGKSAVELAFERGNFEIIPILIKKGAVIKDDIANHIGYIGTKALVMSIVSHLVDDHGTFTGLKKDNDIIKQLKNELMLKLERFKFLENSLKNIENQVDKLVSNIAEIKVESLMLARDKRQITKILAPYINKFIGEVAYE